MLGVGDSRKGHDMLGKIAAAIIGNRMAGRNKGARGAAAGIVVESVAKRLIPTIMEKCGCRVANVVLMSVGRCGKDY